MRRLDRPVISVGNLSVGGSGKTPVVAHLARLLQDCGERPAILTRGYGRRRPSAGVTVVSDGTKVLEGLDASGDEPLMLAEMLTGVPVLVGGDRFLSGRVAEQELGATVHLLDDGFQHVALARNVDFLLADDEDVADAVIPAGRLREPLENATRCDALLVPEGPAGETTARALVVPTRFVVRRAIQAPRSVTPLTSGSPMAWSSGGPVVAVAGIARPERFFSDLTSAGWNVVGTRSFRDHHYFSRSEIERIVVAAVKARAAIVLTTEKDAVRLPVDAVDVQSDRPIASVPLVSSVEPADEFRAWLLGQIR